MNRYVNVKVNISEGQKQMLQSALQEGGPVSIRIGYDGEDVLGLTKSQVTNIAKAYQGGKGTTIKMSKSQLAHNMKVEGGFLGMLASLAARALPTLAKTVLPALGVGALTCLASSGVQKVMGQGLYLKKGGCICQVETVGKGLYLGPVSGSGFAAVGDGLYLKKGGQLYDGKKSVVKHPNSRPIPRIYRVLINICCVLKKKCQFKTIARIMLV